LSGFAVLPLAAVELLDHLPASDPFAERGEAVLIEPRIVAEVDIDLRRTRAGTGVGISDETGLIALADRIVGEGTMPPFLRDLRVSGDAELRPSAGDDAEASRIVEVFFPDQAMKAVRAARRPIAVNLDDEIAGGGFEFHFIDRLGDRWDREQG